MTTLEQAIQHAINTGNLELAEQLKSLNPTGNQDLMQSKVKIEYKIEKFDGEKTEGKQPVETLIIKGD